MYCECMGSEIPTTPVKPITSPFYVTKIFIRDDTSASTLTIPSGTNFLILMQLSYSSSASTTTVSTGNSQMIAIVDTVGSSSTISVSKNFYDGEIISTTATLTWTSATSARLTRNNNRGWAWVLACKYI